MDNWENTIIWHKTYNLIALQIYFEIWKNKEKAFISGKQYTFSKVNKRFEFLLIKDVKAGQLFISADGSPWDKKTKHQTLIPLHRVPSVFQLWAVYHFTWCELNYGDYP